MPIVIGSGSSRFDDIVDALVDQFDASRAKLVRFANERHRQMVSDAEWRVEAQTFGNTQAGVSAYDLPSDVVDIRDLEVGGERYARTSHETIRDLQRGNGNLNGNAGGYALVGSSTSERQFEVFPTPTGVLPVVAWGASAAPTLVYGNGDAPVFPQSFDHYLLAGARADAYRRVDDRPDMAGDDESIFQSGVEKLKRFGKKQFGAPSSRMKLAGVDY